MVNDYRTVVLPTIDRISSSTFELFPQMYINDFAGRGAFDWKLNYKLLPLQPSSRSNPTKPFETPVMAGGLFAISAKFFWELGGYDKGLDTYGEWIFRKNVLTLAV